MLSEYQQAQFIFNIIAWIALALFVVGLPRKMLGVEIINCCQMALLSLCLYGKPIFLYTSLEGLNPVTGGWSLFSNNNSLLPKLTDMINLSPIFIESSIIVVGSLVAVLILWGFFMLCKHCSCQIGNDIETDK